MSDLETIRLALRFLKEPGELIELRCDHLVSERKVRLHGYYDDREKFARDAEEFEGNCYFTVNRLDPAIPATNELRRCKQGACTKAENIIRRTLLYVDCDAVKPAGTPSTDASMKQQSTCAAHPAATRMVDVARGFRQRSLFVREDRPRAGQPFAEAGAQSNQEESGRPPPSPSTRRWRACLELAACSARTTTRAATLGVKQPSSTRPERVVTEEILPPPGVTVTPELLAA